jgi:heme/copper-type cytochrome/quinol oxidase subunit 2
MYITVAWWLRRYSGMADDRSIGFGFGCGFGFEVIWWIIIILIIICLLFPGFFGGYGCKE